MEGIYDETFIYITADYSFDLGQKTHRNAPYAFFVTNDHEVRDGGERIDVILTVPGEHNLEKMNSTA